MVELKYVERRRRRRIVAVITSIGAIGCTVLAIVSFLGRKTGTFSITMHNSGVELALMEALDTPDDQTRKYLYVGDLPSFTEWTYPYFAKYNGGDEGLDNEKHDYLYGATYDADRNPDGLHFFKYTFYVKNIGKTTADFDFSIDCLDRYDGVNNSYGLDETLRIAVYENVGASVEHEKTTYAKRISKTEDIDPEEHIDDREYLYKNGPLVDENFSNDYRGESITFVSRKISNFKPKDVIRYTIVYWIEGDDPQCVGEWPEGCSIKLGVQIKGYEKR